MRVGRENDSGGVELLSEADLGQGSFNQHFAIPAMRAPFPDFLLIIPMSRSGHVPHHVRGIDVVHLPAGRPWSEARVVCTLGWDELTVTQDSDGMAHEEWREWNPSWFARRIGLEVRA